MENERSIKDKITSLVSLTLRAESAIFGSRCGSLGALKSTFQASSYLVSKSPLKVRCWAGSNSHNLKARGWHGRIRRMSMTWTTLRSEEHTSELQSQN